MTGHMLKSLSVSSTDHQDLQGLWATARNPHDQSSHEPSVPSNGTVGTLIHGALNSAESVAHE